MKSYEAMVRRCTDANDKDFKNYGARGITVHQPWLDDFQVFVADMGVKPKGHSLGRINNNADYSPENCRWESAKDQANNRRNNKLLTHNGQTKTISQWADDIGICRKVIAYRVRAGWAMSDVLSPIVDRTIRRAA